MIELFILGRSPSFCSESLRTPQHIAILKMKYNETLIPTLIDERAQAQPEKLYCAIINTLDIENSVVNISYAEFANAVNRCAWWLEDKLGTVPGFPTVAYAGPNDIRYAILTLAAVKTGYNVGGYSLMNVR